MFLGGLEPKDVATEGVCLRKLHSLMKRLTGNLIDVHNGISENKRIPPVYGPYHDFAVASWQIRREDGSNQGVFGLTGCDVII